MYRPEDEWSRLDEQGSTIKFEKSGRVINTLIVMYLVDHHIHQWLVLQIRKWEPLANALYDVGCFMKSQWKRSPAICDKQLFRLWCV